MIPNILPAIDWLFWTDIAIVALGILAAVDLARGWRRK
jgi:hypothetical protein